MKEHIIAREGDSELMLYHAEDDAVHVLNPTARRIFELYKEGLGPEDITRRIQTEFLTDPGKEIAADIQACLSELREKGLV
jgi:hypothetical protein